MILQFKIVASTSLASDYSTLLSPLPAGAVVTPMTLQERSLIDLLAEGKTPFKNGEIGASFFIDDKQLDFPALSRAIHLFMSAHDSFKTAFYVDSEGSPCKVVYPTAFPFQVETSEASYDGIMNQCMSLSKPPLLRVVYYRNPKGLSELVFRVHHLISDGYSAGICFGVVDALYQCQTRIFDFSSLALDVIPGGTGRYSYRHGGALHDTQRQLCETEGFSEEKAFLSDKILSKNELFDGDGFKRRSFLLSSLQQPERSLKSPTSKRETVQSPLFVSFPSDDSDDLVQPHTQEIQAVSQALRCRPWQLLMGAFLSTVAARTGGFVPNCRVPRTGRTYPDGYLGRTPSSQYSIGYFASSALYVPPDLDGVESEVTPEQTCRLIESLKAPKTKKKWYHGGLPIDAFVGKIPGFTHPPLVEINFRSLKRVPFSLRGAVKKGPDFFVKWWQGKQYAPGLSLDVEASPEAYRARLIVNRDVFPALDPRSFYNEFSQQLRCLLSSVTVAPEKPSRYVRYILLGMGVFVGGFHALYKGR